MNAKISVFVICVEAIIYWLLYNLYDCTFNKKVTRKIPWRHSDVAIVNFKHFFTPCKCLGNVGKIICYHKGKKQGVIADLILY